MEVEGETSFSSRISKPRADPRLSVDGLLPRPVDVSHRGTREEGEVEMFFLMFSADVRLPCLEPLHKLVSVLCAQMQEEEDEDEEDEDEDVEPNFSGQDLNKIRDAVFLLVQSILKLLQMFPLKDRQQSASNCTKVAPSFHRNAAAAHDSKRTDSPACSCVQIFIKLMYFEPGVGELRFADGR